MREPLAENTKRVIALLKDNEPDTPTREALIERILDREELGYKKYGHTMDRRDYTLADWHLHLLEELMDAAQYAMRAGDTELAGYLLDDAYRIQQRIENS